MRRYVKMMMSMVVLEGVPTNEREVVNRSISGIVVLVDMVRGIRGVK